MRRLEVLDLEKPPAQAPVKTSAGQASSGWQFGDASPSRHSWANLQLSPFLQEPFAYALHLAFALAFGAAAAFDPLGDGWVDDDWF